MLTQGFTLTVTDDNGDVFVKKTTRELPIQRNKVVRMSVVEVSMEASVPSKLGIYPDGGTAHIYNPESEQISVYTAEGNVWVRFINPASLHVIEVGPIPVSTIVGSTFSATVCETVCGVRQSSTEYKMEVLSIDNGILTLTSGQSRFILRF